MASFSICPSIFLGKTCQGIAGASFWQVVVQIRRQEAQKTEDKLDKSKDKTKQTNNKLRKHLQNTLNAA